MMKSINNTVRIARIEEGISDKMTERVVPIGEKCLKDNDIIEAGIVHAPQICFQTKPSNITTAAASEGTTECDRDLLRIISEIHQFGVT